MAPLMDLVYVESTDDEMEDTIVHRSPSPTDTPLVTRSPSPSPSPPPQVDTSIPPAPLINLNSLHPYLGSHVINRSSANTSTHKTDSPISSRDEGGIEEVECVVPARSGLADTIQGVVLPERTGLVPCPLVPQARLPPSISVFLQGTRTTVAPAGSGTPRPASMHNLSLPPVTVPRQPPGPKSIAPPAPRVQPKLFAPDIAVRVSPSATQSSEKPSVEVCDLDISPATQCTSSCSSVPPIVSIESNSSSRIPDKDQIDQPTSCNIISPSSSLSTHVIMAKHSPSGSSRDIDSSIKITDNLIVESEVAIESHKNIKVVKPEKFVPTPIVSQDKLSEAETKSKSNENIEKAKPEELREGLMPSQVAMPCLTSSTEKNSMFSRILETLKKRMKFTDEGIAIGNTNCRTARFDKFGELYGDREVTRPYYQIKHNVEDQFQSPVQVNTSLYLATH